MRPQRRNMAWMRRRNEIIVSGRLIRLVLMPRSSGPLTHPVWVCANCAAAAASSTAGLLHCPLPSSDPGR